jgi:hypothetical protein
MLDVLHRRRLDRSFCGSAPPARMREHLAACPRCRERYRRHLLAESALPDGEERAAERLWREIEGAAGRRPTRRWIFPLVLAGATAAMVLLARPRPPVPRGPSTSLPPSLHVFRASAGAVEPLAGQLHTGDGLLFAYSNPGDTYRHLMVFADDGRGRVYWYYPPYQREGEDPAAVTIERHRAGVELREVIRQPLAPGPLRLHALFLTAPVTVRDVEERLARGDLDRLGGQHQSWPLEVLP